MTTAAPNQRTLVTVIAESALEREVTRELDALGVGGYTITDARGRGSRGKRSSNWAHSGNIRIEVVCDRPLSEKVMQRLREKYYENYAMIMFCQDVEVLRPEKFR
jgi:nitrogen regulatory protein PII